MFWFFYVIDRNRSVGKDFFSEFRLEWKTPEIPTPESENSGFIGFFWNGLRHEEGGGFILDPGIPLPVSEKNEPAPFGYSQIRFDAERKTVNVARDSLGIGNAYYHLWEGILILASSQKTVLRYLKETGRSISIDRQAFYESFAYRTTASDRTLLSEIVPIRFGSEYAFGTDFKKNEVPELRSKIKKFPIEFKAGGPLEDERGSYARTFSEIIERYPTNKDFCVLFTGGLDSTVLLHAGQIHGKRVRAFTVMQDTECGDDRIARSFCEARKIPHEIIRLPNELETILRNAVRSVEDADSILCGLSVSLKMAADRARELGITTLLSGSYVEPILGSNPSTLLMLKTLSCGIAHPTEHRGSVGGNNLLSEGKREEAERLERTANELVRVDAEYIAKISWMTKEIFHGIGSGKKVPIQPWDFFEKSFTEEILPDRNVLSDCEFSIGEDRKIFDLLTHVDLSYRGNIRNNLLNERIGNDSEVPIVPIFAHSNLRNAVFRSDVSKRFLPTKYPTTYADNKYFFKSALSGVIPEEILERKKSDGSVPLYALWLFDDRNSAFIRASFDKLLARKIFSSAVIGLLLKIREKNVRVPRISMEELLSKGVEWPLTDTYMRALWKMLALEIWMEEFLD